MIDKIIRSSFNKKNINKKYFKLVCEELRVYNYTIVVYINFIQKMYRFISQKIQVKYDELVTTCDWRMTSP